MYALEAKKFEFLVHLDRFSKYKNVELLQLLIPGAPVCLGWWPFDYFNFRVGYTATSLCQSVSLLFIILCIYNFACTLQQPLRDT